MDIFERGIKSETQRGNSVTYSDKENIYTSVHPLITQEIYIYLKPYLKKDPTAKAKLFTSL